MIVTVPNPVSEGVGYDPTLPVIEVVPVLVMPVAARMAKGEAVPSDGAVAPLEMSRPKAAKGKNSAMTTVARITVLVDFKINQKLIPSSNLCDFVRMF